MVSENYRSQKIIEMVSENYSLKLYYIDYYLYIYSVKIKEIYK